jgi:Uma2 family endonuclease
MGSPRSVPATIETFLEHSPDERLELIHGTLIEKPLASTDHSLAQASTPIVLGHLFQRKPGGHLPGGWWFNELAVKFGQDIVKPDVCGYRRERMPQPPQTPVIELAPDWTCELISPNHEARDRVEKARIYHRGGVPHSWLMNSLERTLDVLRRADIGWSLIQTAQRGDRIRAEPFEAVELRVDELFGDDPEEE